MMRGYYSHESNMVLFVKKKRKKRTVFFSFNKRKPLTLEIKDMIEMKHEIGYKAVETISLWWWLHNWIPLSKFTELG